MSELRWAVGFGDFCPAPGKNCRLAAGRAALAPAEPRLYTSGSIEGTGESQIDLSGGL
jgi:hypothetical protein